MKYLNEAKDKIHKSLVDHYGIDFMEKNAIVFDVNVINDEPIDFCGKDMCWIDCGVIRLLGNEIAIDDKTFETRAEDLFCARVICNNNFDFNNEDAYKWVLNKIINYIDEGLREYVN